MNKTNQIELSIEIKYKDGIPCQLGAPIKYDLNGSQILLFNDFNKLKSVGSIKINVSERVHSKLIEIENNWKDCERDKLEDPLKALIFDKIDELNLAIQKLYRLLRWMYLFKGADNNIDELNIYWSITKQNRILLNTPKFPRTELVGLIGFDEKDFERNLATISQLDDDEPVQHSIIRDAYEIVNSNPKNSLLLSIIALEVGIKDFISKSIPAASWIVFNIQTPPVDRIISEYLYTINPLIKLNEEQLKLIKQLIKERNVLSHKGTFSITITKLHEGLELIKDILYLLDYYRGHKWAIHKLTILKADDYKIINTDEG